MIYFEMKIGEPQEVKIMRAKDEGKVNKNVTTEEVARIAQATVDAQQFKTINGEDIRGTGNIEIVVPTKVSELENDANYATRSEIPTRVSQLENDSNYATKSEIPTRVSQLENDKEYQTLTETETKINEAVKDKVDSEKINSIWVGTEAEYNKINPKNEKILYVII